MSGQFDQPNKPNQSDKPNLPEPSNPIDPFAISWGAILEGMYESGVKMHNCSVFYEELSKIPEDKQAEILTHMTVVNSFRRDDDSSLPEVIFKLKGDTATVGFPGCPDNTPEQK